MKRPEGFDGGPRPTSSAAPAPAGRPEPRPAPAPVASRSPSAPRLAPLAEEPRGESKRPTRAERPPKRQKPLKPPQDRPVRRDSEKAQRRREQAELRRAARNRRRAEREELRRFTRRARNRRAALIVASGLVASLVGLVLIAVFSPLLALREIRVEGAERVDAAALTAELESQLGTPLALVDYGRIDAILQGYPHIRSYSTETLPPDTIVVRLVERSPIVVVERDGGYALIDPAGIVLAQSAERVPGIPLVTGRGATVPSPAFDAAVEVLLAMPAELRVQVDTVTASTRDDVTLTLADAAQTVRWGSADGSAQKAELLAALRAIHGQTPGAFDVSAPGNGIFREG